MKGGICYVTFFFTGVLNMSSESESDMAFLVRFAAGFLALLVFSPGGFLGFVALGAVENTIYKLFENNRNLYLALNLDLAANSYARCSKLILLYGSLPSGTVFCVVIWCSMSVYIGTCLHMFWDFCDHKEQRVYAKFCLLLGKVVCETVVIFQNASFTEKTTT